MLRGLRNEGIFTPPSFQGSIVVPGHHGGANIGAAAGHPRTGMLYVRNIDRPGINRLSTTKPADWSSAAAGEVRYYGTYASPIRASNSLLGIAPPWSEIVAYEDLNEGTIRWRIPLGSTPALPTGGTGVEHAWRNGPVVTASGLLFVGSASDRKVHAFDAGNGASLWEAELPSNPDGIPAVYQVKGKQYVVFFANSGSRGAANIWKASPADAQGYYAFALP